MPFDQQFDSAYQDLIEPALSESGYAVSRADELQNHRSILRDIVQSIEQASLIVADLTGDNPNVYYELGIAHALNKPVIMMTQGISHLPFDLKPYKVIPYSLQLSNALRAKTALHNAAAGLLTGMTHFGNPVSDSLGIDIASPTPIASPIPDATHGDAPLGILDHAEHLERHIQAMNTSMTRISARTTEYAESLQTSTTDFENLARRSATGPTRQEIRKLLRATTTSFDGYATFLMNENNTYQAILDPLEASLDGLIALQKPSTAEQRREFSSSLESLGDLHEAAESALAELSEMSVAIDSIPPLEQKFNQSQQRVSRQVGRLLANIGRTASIVNRAKELGEAKLAE